jgi:uncharacterized membrane protein
MTLLILGLLIWTAAHYFKRVAPQARAALHDRLGDASKGVFAALLILSVVLMVMGYRAADTSYLYQLGGWTVPVNNLLMLGSVFLFGAGGSKGRARSWMRHPMLTGFLVWVIAHLLVNGDTASLVLFGGLGLWAIGSIILINATSPAWERPEPGPVKGDIKLLVISIILYAVITIVHGYLGPSPFGR